MSNPAQRFLLSYPKSSKVVQALQQIVELTEGMYTPAEIAKMAIKEYLDKLLLTKNRVPDLTLQDIERIGWDKISTQELIDRYPPYRKQYNQAYDDYEPCTPEENEEILKELGL